MNCTPGIATPKPASDLRFLEAGSGETILLLHGSTGNSTTWKRLAQTLAPAYRVLAPDLIGYGHSAPWHGERPLALADEAARLRAMLPCCGRVFHLVGYSYGGALALQMALQEPARVKSLVLIEPVFFGALRYAGATDDYAAFAAVRDDFAAGLAAGDGERAMQRFIDFWNGDGAWQRLTPVIRQELSGMAAKIAEDWAASFAFDPGAEPLGAHGLARKTHLLRGDRSPRPMQRLVDALHRLMPGSARTVIPGANHLLPLTHGPALSNIVLHHLHEAAERALT